ncbi:MAG: flagellar filament capping protein FliD [Planctomycetota bacterium]
MLSIDGLITGLDTSSIISGLLEIQQSQIDTLSQRRTDVLNKQAAFSGVEARVLSFRSSLSRLTSIRTTALQDKVVTSSDDTIVEAAASENAVVGNYRLRVDSLARSHQIATAGFDSLATELGTGDFTIQVGDGASQTITLDETNNTVEGLVDAINRSGADVTASVVNDGSDTPYRIMLTADETGTSNQIAVTSGLTGGEAVSFDLDTPVQEATNAQVTFGQGDGAISVTSEDNRIEDLIVGVTLNLKDADPDKEITLNVGQDVEGGFEAVSGFVSAYNDLVNHVNEQIQFNAETQVAGILLGERSVTEIADELSFALSSVIPGLESNSNRLSAVGITFNDNGTLDLDEGQLRDAISGQVDGVSAEDVARLFTLSAETSRNDVTFVVGNSNTVEGDYGVDITAAATQAFVEASDEITGTVTIHEDNNTINLVIDGVSTGELTLAEGDYTADELAAEIQSVINNAPELGNRDVTVVNDDGFLLITSEQYGSNSEITFQSGTAWEDLGFNGDETDTGSGIQGHFIVNGEIESATGRGNTLIGDEGNANTEDLQIRISIPADEIGDGVEASISVTRGMASRLDQIIGDMVGTEGDFRRIDERFDLTSDSILESIERLNAQFETQQQSLISQFAALERAVGDLQNTGNFIASQFAGISGLSI